MYHSSYLKKYEYQKLPIGLCNSSDIFQEKMNELFNGLDYVRTYIDDLLTISKKSVENHNNKLDSKLTKIKAAGFKINAVNSFLLEMNWNIWDSKLLDNGLCLFLIK